MSTSEVATAWQEQIWEHATILAFTTKIYPRELTDLAEADISDLSYQQQINYIEWAVRRTVQYPIVSGGAGQDETYQVEVRYSIEADPHSDRAQANYQRVTSFVDTLVDLVKSGLGNSWDETVDYYRPQTEPWLVVERAIAGTSVWSVVYRFQGFKRVHT